MADDWNSEENVEDALQFFECCHPVWHSIVSKADMMEVYTVGYRTECPLMVKGKAVVISDAAHPMLPTYAQGGDIFSKTQHLLRYHSAGMESCENLETRLRIFEQLHLPWSTTTQVLRNGVFVSGSMTKEEISRKYYHGSLFCPLDAPGFSRVTTGPRFLVWLRYIQGGQKGH